MEEETDNANAGFRILGKRIGDIPCFKDSYFYGISTGIFTSFVYFMSTSHVGKATNFGMGAFAISTLSYWTYCRISYSQEIKEALKLKAYLEEYNATHETKQLATETTINSVSV